MTVDNFLKYIRYELNYSTHTVLSYSIDLNQFVNYLTNDTTPIYDLDLFSGQDGYDLFLSGTQPLLRIDNPAGEDGKTLVVFRDSYGSSLTPLLTEAYSTVYVVDIRYTNANTLTMYEKMGRVDFSGADVLFAYSSLILNSNSFQ